MLRHALLGVLLTLPLPALAQTAAQATYTDRSGTVTLGGTAQAAMAANSQRRGCFIQNQSTGDLWFNSLTTAAAVQPSLWLPAGAFYACPPSGIPTGALSIFGATTGQAFAAREW